MADDTSRTLLLQINATTELLRSQMSQAEQAIGNFTGKAEEHLSRFDVAMETATEKTKQLGEAFGITAGLFAIDALVEAAHRGLEYAASLGHISAQLGVTTRDLQVFRFAASQTGVGAEDADRGLQKFTKSLGEARTGSEKAAKIFKALGFTDDDIAHLDVHDALLKTADGISEVHDRATRAVPEVGLFGRAGQQLDPIFSGGSKSIKDFADQADRLGLIIPEEFIEKAHTAEARVASLKAQLSVNVSKTVAENADAIVTLANALGSLASKAAQGFSAYNGFLNIIKHQGIGGGIASFFGDGSDQKLAGSTEGYAKLAIQQYNQSLAELRQAQRNGQTPEAGLQPLAREVVTRHTEAVRAMRELQEERAKQKAGEIAEGGGRTLEGLNGPKPKKARAGSDDDGEAAKQKEIERAKRVADQAARLDDQALGYQLQLTADIGEQLSFAQAKVNRDEAKQIADINADHDAKKITDEEYKTLRLKIERNADLAADEINRRGAAAAEQKQQAVEDAQLEAAKELLGVQVTLAGTRQQRLDQELKLLALEKEAERQRLTATATDVDDKGNLLHSDRDVAVANKQLGTLDARYDGKVAEKKAASQSPLDDYRKSLQGTVGDTKALNDSLQNAAVDGLKGLEDAFAGVVTGSKSVGAAIKEMAASVLSDLAKIVAEKAILSLLGFAGGGRVGSSSSANAANGGYDIDVDVAALAGGGPINGPGSGTSDSILARLSNGEFVVNAQATSKHLGLIRAINDNSLPGFASGGLIGPIVAPSIGSLSMAASAPDVHIHNHFKGAVVTQDLIDHANAAAAMSYTESVKHTNRSIAGMSRRTL